MSYYGQGDYYGTGDYYGQGGFFSAIGRGLKKAAEIGVGVATGGIAGGVRAALPRPQAPRLPSPTQPMPLPVPTSFPGPMMPSIPVMVPQPGAVAAVQRFLPGGATGMAPSVQPAGYHLNKSGYFLRSGEYVPPGTRWVRNRSRNFANGRALNRSISRVTGFTRLVKRSRKSLKACASI